MSAKRLVATALLTILCLHLTPAQAQSISVIGVWDSYDALATAPNPRQELTLSFFSDGHFAGAIYKKTEVNSPDYCSRDEVVAWVGTYVVGGNTLMLNAPDSLHNIDDGCSPSNNVTLEHGPGLEQTETTRLSQESDAYTAEPLTVLYFGKSRLIRRRSTPVIVPPTGIPQELVGDWFTGYSGGGLVSTIHPDGTFLDVAQLGSGTTCEITITSQGTIEVREAVMIVRTLSGNSVGCGSTVAKPITLTVKVYAWHLETTSSGTVALWQSYGELSRGKN